MKNLEQEYKTLHKRYGNQGWWPLMARYHPGDYDYPKTDDQKFEICVGAILAQNTAWVNVEKALANLGRINCKKLIDIPVEELKEKIRPAGYYNQKARKLKGFASFFAKLKGKPSREELLALWGIGPETADSILLYAFKEPVFVVDAYTKRVFNMQDKSYDEVQQHFHKNLPRDYRLFQEFHALIVEEGKCVRKG